MMAVTYIVKQTAATSDEISFQTELVQAAQSVAVSSFRLLLSVKNFRQNPAAPNYNDVVREAGVDLSTAVRWMLDVVQKTDRKLGEIQNQMLTVRSYMIRRSTTTLSVFPAKFFFHIFV